MERNFKAKDIRRIIGISKIRYEYLGLKRIGIKPGIEEVRGTGRVHGWNFKNLLQFGYAHNANKLGLSPRSVVELLSWLDELDEKHDIYNTHVPESLSVHYVNLDGFRYFLVTGKGLQKGENTKAIYPGSFERLKKALEDKDKNDPVAKLIESKAIYKDEGLALADGYVTINISAIKKRILERLSGDFFTTDSI
jgi:hypothetical protein